MLIRRSRLVQRVAALNRLLRVTLRLAAQTDVDELLERITSGACEAVQCERASLFLYDSLRHELYTRTTTELEISEIRHSLDVGIAGWVAREQMSIHVPVPAADPRWNPDFDRRTGFHTRNILAVPVLSDIDGRLLGVLQLLNHTGPGFGALEEQLTQVLASHAATALERQRLLDEARHARELQAALETARRIQCNLLPKDFPHVPGYSVSAYWQPAEYVSGDYYDWQTLPDGRLALVLGDVSGHGIGAALIMASVRAMWQVLMRTDPEPAKMLSLLGEALASDLTDGRFLTLMLVTINPATHELRFANAGHAPALLYCAATQEFQPLRATALPVGFPQLDTGPADEPWHLEPGDLLFLGTDGIVEVPNPQGERFHTSRLMDLIRTHAHEGPSVLAELIGQTIQEFHGGPLLPDDCTLVIVARHK